jgi:diguanylate cyclase (GGDEF)-like protein
MDSSSPRTPPTAALRLARKAWRLLYSDSRQCVALAEQAFARASKRGDLAAQGRARMALGFHLIWYATPAEAMQELREAQTCLDSVGDRAGHLLAEVGVARAIWRSGNFRASLDRVLPLRDEGLQLLKHDERGMLLNTIAGCFSELGQPQQAFAYMYQAMRESSAAQGDGFDVVLYCNLAHELIQLGDYHQALSYLEEGMERCQPLHNARLFSVLSINRVICLTGLERPAEAMHDVQRLLSLSADKVGRGAMNANYETLAIAALRAGHLELGADLVARAGKALAREAVPDERLTLVVAQAELMQLRGQAEQAAAHLQAFALQMADRATEGLSLRVRCLCLRALADALEGLGQVAPALMALRAWQQLHIERTLLASSARYQAAALQTELLRMRHELRASNARRRTTERARAELEAANEQLMRRVAEIEALQRALKLQATRDFLTGLFNRRHLDDVLPSMLAMAQRDAQPLAVVIIDLDHFKNINDSLGHAAGDKLLSDFGQLLSLQCRKSDVACRYGGEEFCLLMPRTLASAARRKTLGLLKLWSATAGDHARFKAGTLTFSAGIADSQGSPGAAANLLQAADEALLQAKRLGRNRVQLHPTCTRAAA